MKDLIRIQITNVHPKDAHYPYKDKLIGMTGTFGRDIPNKYKEYYPGKFTPDIRQEDFPGHLYFIGIRYKRI